MTRFLTAIVFALLFATPAFAQQTVDVATLDLADTGDTAWMLAASALVMMLVLPGLSLFYCARVQSKNSLSMLVQGMGVAAIVSFLWVIVGYTLAFGGVSGGWLGAGNAWMLIGLGNIREGLTVPESAYVLFQLTLAILAVVIMTGAWAERARFAWVLTFCGLWSLIVYAPVAHWIWGGGWLAQSGVIDYGGGIVVLTSAGVSALVAAILVGWRKTGDRVSHSPMLGLLGTAMLWIGWLGLVGGLALAANDDAASAMINTHIAASVAVLAGLGLDRWRHGSVGVTGISYSAIAGLAIILPAAGYVSPGGAIIIGILAVPLSRLARKVIRFDDALAVFATFGVSGMLGAVLLGIFGSASVGGVLTDVSIAGQVGTQILGVAVVAAWSAFASTVIALGISMAVPMRVSAAEEEEGLDAGLRK